MSDTSYGIWCYVKGDKTPFQLLVSPTISMLELREMVTMTSANAASVPITALSLWKVNTALNVAASKLKEHKFELKDNAQAEELDSEIIITIASDVWPEPPPDGHIHLFVDLPKVGRPTLNVGDERPVVDLDFIKAYKDTFIKVKEWGVFESSDIERNGIYMCSDDTPVPNFVADFERELDSKPGLARDAYNTYKSIEDVKILDAYFGPRRTVEGQSLEEFSSENESHRDAEKFEVLHLAYIASGDWQLLWNGTLGSSLKEPSMTAIFFQYFILHVRTITARTSNWSWPFNFIAKCETLLAENKQLRKFQPRSDFLISKSILPRLIVEVNSKPMAERPEDLVRMLVTGAAVVRFANGFLDRFKGPKNFVLCAIYIWGNGKVTRYSMFQEPGNPKVRCNDTIHWLDYSAGCGNFVRQLYNLRHMLERDEKAEDANEKIEQLKWSIDQHNKNHPMMSFHTDNTKDTSDSTDCVELGEHGYEVEPRAFVDESGYVMESFSHARQPFSTHAALTHDLQTPPHILTVYKGSDPDKRFIAKKVREGSNELEIFELLNTFQPTSEHIISLHESFQTQSMSWAILPEMNSIVSLAPEKLDGKVVQVCWGLIKGVAYLHKFCIAHRDIKPENLVVDREFCLKIIDFDLSMRVEDEDEVVEDQCGTEGWIAPEIEDKLMYSPIKADRWSTGKVLRYLLNVFRQEDTFLRTTVVKLTAYDPNQRWSMLQVAGSLSDVANVAIAKRSSRSLQDTEEVDGENAKPPKAKKQKVSVLDGTVLRDHRQ